MIQPDLRPLRIGEILDRAVTLFVRHFAIFMLILALVAIPVDLCRYISAPQTVNFIDDLQRYIAIPPGHQREQQALIAHWVAQNRLSAWSAILVFAGLLFNVVSYTACVLAVGESSAGRVASVRDVYRRAVRCWLPQIVAIAAFAGLAIVLLVGLTIVVFLIALAFGALSVVSTAAATIVGIAFAVLGVLVFIASFALLYLAATLSFISIALEQANPIRGIAHGLRRTLSPPIFWRSLLVSLIAFIVTFLGSLVLVAVAAGISVVSHISALYPIVAVIGGLVLNALVLTFVVMYSIDVRVRREGYDLAIAAQSAAI